MVGLGAGFDVTPFLHQDEGQHFDRKSLFHGPPDAKEPRKRKEVRDQVARWVAGFANAEGGVLILGIEDDHTLSGHQLPPAALQTLLAVPQARCEPPLPPGFVVPHDGHELVVFDVPSTDGPVQVTGDGFPLRMGDQTVDSSESKIQALKLQGLVESHESRPSALKLADLNSDLLAQARRGAGLESLSDADYLLKRKLADRRGSELVLRQAAELLFARLGPDHPNAGVRVFRVVGTERRLGATHNVEERPRIEGNLPEVWQEAVSVIGGLMRQPSRLVGNRFQAVSEYPRFSWQEALLNAIAHRDYSLQGNCIEVWLFDDRMEVVSPGGLLPELNLQELLSRKRVHCSRNPRLMRTLVDLGLTRDQGEGIPRMFAEMEDAFLPAPRIEPTPRNVTVVLGNTTTLTEGDRSFVERLASEELTQEEFRALLQAHRHTQVDNASLRQLIGLDTLGASQVLRRLRDRELLELHPAGSQSFYTLGPGLLVGDRPGQGHLVLDRGAELHGQGSERQQQQPHLAELRTKARPPVEAESMDKGGPEHVTAHVAEHVTAQVLQLLRACRGEQSRADLMDAVGLTHREHFREAYLVPALAVGYLEMTIPDKPKSSRQKYRLTPAGHTFLNTFPTEQP